MLVLVGYTGTTDGEAAYAYLYTVDGKLYGACRHWRQTNSFNVPGYFSLTEQYHGFKLITYKNAIMYYHGETTGTRVKAGTIINAGDGYNYMNRYFIFD